MKNKKYVVYEKLNKLGGGKSFDNAKAAYRPDSISSVFRRHINALMPSLFTISSWFIGSASRFPKAMAQYCRPIRSLPSAAV